jgi:hypothetical protein
MARKSTRELIQETKKGFTKLEQQLESVLELRAFYKKDVANARRRLTRKKKSDYPNKLFEEIRVQLVAQEVLQNSLRFAIDQATEVNDEFAKSAYKASLYEVAGVPDIYKLFKVGDGWNAGLNLQIVFEEEAGTLADWARGIELARDELGVEPRDGRSRAGFKATMWWIEHVFGTSLEDRTIHRRIENSMRPAAFWQILNHGSQPLASDRRDGSFNPLPSSPTDFIGEAEASVRRFFLSFWLPEKNKWMQETLELEQTIERFAGVLEALDYDIARLGTELQQNERIYQSFGEKKKFLDKNRLEDALERLRAGEQFEKPQVELTKSGSAFRVRPTVRKLEGLLRDY